MGDTPGEIHQTTSKINRPHTDNYPDVTKLTEPWEYENGNDKCPTQKRMGSERNTIRKDRTPTRRPVGV
jgi:hypothetical protein